MSLTSIILIGIVGSLFVYLMIWSGDHKDDE
jgi:hypothetical protein